MQIKEQQKTSAQEIEALRDCEKATATSAKDSLQGRIKRRYKVTSVLGQGSNGTVYKARDRDTAQPVALKMIRYKADSFYKFKQILREISILRRLSELQAGGEAYVPKLLDVLSSTDSPDERGETELCIVMELITGTSLDQFLDKALRKKIPLRPDNCKILVANLLKAIDFIHKAGVVHRDIKPANLMVTPDLRIKLVDFGLARTLVYDLQTQAANIPMSKEEKKQIGRILDTERGTRKHCKRSLSPHVCARIYRPPEIALTEDYSYSADIWSVGCVTAEILQCQTMYDLENEAPRFLFLAYSSYPMSPDGEAVQNENIEDRLAKDDLLKAILGILGTQRPYDLSFITRSQRRKIIKNCQSRNDKVRFQMEFPGTPADLTQVLDKSLEFNPYFRFSASQLLALLDSSLGTESDESTKSTSVTGDERMAPNKGVQKFCLEFDTPGAFDYDLLKPLKHSLSDLHDLLKIEQQILEKQTKE